MGIEVRPRILPASLRTLSTLMLLTSSLAVQAGWQPYATAEEGLWSQPNATPPLGIPTSRACSGGIIRAACPQEVIELRKVAAPGDSISR